MLNQPARHEELGIEFLQGLMRLKHSFPGGLVIATGESHSNSEFLEEAFKYQDLDWRE